MAVKHGFERCTLLADYEKTSRLSQPSAWGNFSVSSTWSTRAAIRWETRPTFLWSTGTSSGNRQETETCTVRACHTPRHPLQNHLLRHLGGWATSWSAEEMPDGQHQRVDIPADAKTAYNGLPQKRLDEGLWWIVPYAPPPPPPTPRPNRSRDWTELNWTWQYRFPRRALSSASLLTQAFNQTTVWYCAG